MEKWFTRPMPLNTHTHACAHLRAHSLTHTMIVILKSIQQTKHEEPFSQVFTYAIVPDSVYLFNYPLLQMSRQWSWCKIKHQFERNHRRNSGWCWSYVNTTRRIISKIYFVKNNMRSVFVQVINTNSKQKNGYETAHMHTYKRTCTYTVVNESWFFFCLCLISTGFVLIIYIL